MHLRFSPKIRLLGEAPQSPGKGRFAALPNAPPQVERLRALTGAEYGRDRLERSHSVRQDA